MATPIELPLPGGSAGAEVRVHPLLVAEAPVPPLYFKRTRSPAGIVRGLTGKREVLPIPAFLVEHPTAGAFMVDAGVNPIVAERGMRADLGPIGGTILGVRMQPGWGAGDRIKALGFDPLAIDLVVMTHLHFDHAGGSHQFPNATFLVHQPEWDDEPGLTKGSYAQHRDAVSDWRTFTLPEAPWEGFTRTADLFGDGSVRLLSTPGHTAGHVSLALRLRGGRDALLVADAAYARRSLDARDVPLVCPDVRTYLRSLDELRAHVAAHPETLVVCGHDPWEWPSAVRQLEAEPDDHQ